MLYNAYVMLEQTLKKMKASEHDQQPHNWHLLQQLVKKNEYCIRQSLKGISTIEILTV